jgi:LmbE family N-acetylglucosaminyl deacetylase
MVTAIAMAAGEAQRRMRALPFATLDAIAPGTSLILAPHPDDESLGCGGLIAMASACGRPPVIVGVTDGAGSHPNSRSHPPPLLRATRAAELLDAAATLGVGAERVHFLNLPDTCAPFYGPDFDMAVAAVGALVRRYRIATVFAPWRFDPHCDHAATAALGEAVAHTSGVQLALYPVWGWLLPQDEALPLASIAGRRLDIAAELPCKRRAIAAHRSQYAELITDDPKAFRLPRATRSVRAAFRSVPRTVKPSLGPAYFDALYAADPDPWQFATSAYEREKYDATLAALPARIGSTFEIGCSIGVLTRRLAERCDSLFAVDVAKAALAAARRRCADQANVTIARMQVPREWPAGRFDAILFSEVLYYFATDDLVHTAARARASITRGGYALLVHYTLPTDYPASGDAAADGFIATSGLTPILQRRAARYRLDLLCA